MLLLLSVALLTGASGGSRVQGPLEVSAEAPSEETGTMHFSEKLTVRRADAEPLVLEAGEGEIFRSRAAASRWEGLAYVPFDPAHGDVFGSMDGAPAPAAQVAWIAIGEKGFRLPR